jgi:nucleoside-diphosphate-sugar epimerase
MKILITGSTGFVGSNLLPYLSNEFKCYTVDRASLQLPTPELFFNATAIVHLAGKAHDLKKTSEADEYYQVNFELTRGLYNAFLKSNASTFIFISSVKAAADIVEGELTEDVDPTPQTHYGKSKLMAEQFIQDQPLPEGKRYYILRPCMIHGPGNKGNLNLLYQFVKKGIPYPLAVFDNKRSFLSIENLCFVIKHLLERNDILPGVYNVADDDPLSTTTVVTTLASSLNVKPKLWNIPSSIIKGFARIGDIFHLPLNTERLTTLTENYVVSNHKIKGALNTRLPLSTVKGLEITANSFNKS